MYTKKCDVCGRTEPEINCSYHYRITLLGFLAIACSKWSATKSGNDGYLHDYDRDMCEDCWKGFQSFMKSKLEIKEGKK